MIASSTKSRIALFGVIVLALIVIQLAFQQWGRQWAMAMYKPVLKERVMTAIAQDNYGLAESDMLLALHTSPQFKGDVASMAYPYLAVMPELRAEIGPIAQPTRSPADMDQIVDPYLKGMALVRFGDSSDAPAAFRASTEADAFRQLGMLLEGEGNSREAAKAYAEAVARATTPYFAAQRLISLAH